MTGGASTPLLPHAPIMKDAWRAVAHRKVRQQGELHHPACVAARNALRAVRPDLSDNDAAEQTINAIYYASHTHPEWLWRGVGSRGGPNKL